MACKNTWKNAVFLEKNRSDIFPPFMGTPMRSRLGKSCFCNERKIEKDFEKEKWHVNIHAKKPFDSRKKKLIFFLLWGYPHAL